MQRKTPWNAMNIDWLETRAIVKEKNIWPTPGITPRLLMIALTV
jgi:hypothetical protein